MMQRVLPPPDDLFYISIAANVVQQGGPRPIRVMRGNRGTPFYVGEVWLDGPSQLLYRPTGLVLPQFGVRLALVTSKSIRVRE